MATRVYGSCLGVACHCMLSRFSFVHYSTYYWTYSPTGSENVTMQQSFSCLIDCIRKFILLNLNSNSLALLLPVMNLTKIMLVFSNNFLILNSCPLSMGRTWHSPACNTRSASINNCKREILEIKWLKCSLSVYTGTHNMVKTNL